MVELNPGSPALKSSCLTKVEDKPTKNHDAFFASSFAVTDTGIYNILNN